MLHPVPAVSSATASPVPPTTATPVAAPVKPRAPAESAADAAALVALQSLLAQRQTLSAPSAAPKPASASGPVEAAYANDAGPRLAAKARAQGAPGAAVNTERLRATVQVGDQLVTVDFTVQGSTPPAAMPDLTAVAHGPPEDSVDIGVSAAGRYSALAVEVGAPAESAKAASDAETASGVPVPVTAIVGD